MNNKIQFKEKEIWEGKKKKKKTVNVRIGIKETENPKNKKPLCLADKVKKIK